MVRALKIGSPLVRKVYHSDLVAVVATLASVPPAERDRLCGLLLCDADWADRYTRRLGKAHPKWGNGTLRAAARAYKQINVPTIQLADYRDCLKVLTTHIDFPL